MDLAFDEAKGYVYCAYCDNVVSRLTYKRHERKRYFVLSKAVFTLGLDYDQIIIELNMKWVHIN